MVFEIVNAAQDDCSSDLPTVELLKSFHPDVPVRGDHGTYEMLLSNREAREVLGLEQKHPWRQYASSGTIGRGGTA